MPRSKGRAQTNDLTHGPIARKLLIFSLPLFLATLAQQLYNTVDLLFAGNILGASAAAAIGASSLFVTCIVGFFGGMSVGSGVVIAQVFGKRETQTLDAAIHSTVALSLIGGVFFMVAGYLAAPWFLAVINTPADIMTEAVVYLRVYFFSLMSVMAYNFGAGALRALGNSKSPLVAQVVGGLCNVVFDWLFLAVLGWGVAGVAWATLVSQTVAAACVIWCLTRLDERYALRLRKIKLDIGVLKHALSIGLPAGFQALAITLSNVIVQYFINSLGTATVAAFALYFKVELVIYLPIVAFGQAIMTFAAQNYGARSYVRIRRGTFIWVGVSALIALATSLAALAGGAWLFRLFVQDAEVIALGCRLIAVTFPFYFLYSALQIFGDSMRGIGKSKVPMFIILANICIFRTLILCMFVPTNPSIEMVGASYPATWALCSVCMAVYFVRYHRTNLDARSEGFFGRRDASDEEAAVEPTGLERLASEAARS